MESYLEAIDQLRASIEFFNTKKGLKSSEGAINHANNLLAKAIVKLEEEFKQLVTNCRFVLAYTEHLKTCSSSLLFYFFLFWKKRISLYMLNLSN